MKVLPLISVALQSTLMVVVAAAGTDDDDDMYYMRFPFLNDIPKTKQDAEAGGFVPWLDTSITGSSCDNGGVGDIYAYGTGSPNYREHGLYPALFYRNYDGKLAGVIFATNPGLVLQKPGDFLRADGAGHPWSNAEADLVGQIYWLQDPSTVCLESVPDPSPERGIFMNIPTCIDAVGDTDCAAGIKKIPEQLTHASLNTAMNMTFTNQLCLEGMGYHFTYGHCSRSYAYAVIADSEGKLNGIVNSIHLNATAIEEYSSGLAQAERSSLSPASWQDFVGPDADKPLFFLLMNNLTQSFPATGWGLPESIEAKPFYDIRGLVFDDEILPIGRVCGEEGKVGYDASLDALDPDCFLCKSQPRLLLHVYQVLPNVDSETCALGHKVTAEGAKKNVVRCGLCQVYLKTAALKSSSDQCVDARNMFDNSCGSALHYGEGSTFDCDPLDYLGGKLLGFNGGTPGGVLTDPDGNPCVWDESAYNGDSGSIGLQEVSLVATAATLVALMVSGM